MPSDATSPQPSGTPKAGLAGILVDVALNTAVNCTLVSAEPGFFRVLTPYAIDLGTELALSFGTASVRAEAVLCSPSAGQFLIGLGLLADERGQDTRRREPRVPVDWPAILTVLDASLPPDPEARLVNFSPSGVAVQSVHQIELGTMVAVDVEAALLFGEVCYSRTGAGESYVSGVRLTEVLAKPEAGGTNAGFGRFWRNLVSQKR